MRDSTTYYCNLGYHLLLLSENSKIPLKNSNGVKQATNNAEQFLSNLSQIPKANLGIAATNCLIIDVDNKNGKNGSNDLAEMERELGPLPECPLVQTPNGRHNYFAIPKVEIVGTAGLLWHGRKTGIDLRIGNQYAVAPPSVINGVPYKWLKPLVPVGDLPELPEPWIDFLENRNQSSSISKSALPASPFDLGLNSPGSYNRPKLIEQCRKYVAKLPAAISGQNGDEQTFIVACAIFDRFGLTPEEGYPILCDYNTAKCQPLWSDEELQHKMHAALAKAADRFIASQHTSSFGSAPAAQDDGDEHIKEWVPFPVDLLPDPLPAFVNSSAKSIGCNEVLIVNPSLAGLAAAIGNTRVLQLKDSGDPWIEPSILWTMSIANSGMKKTPALDATKKRFGDYEQKAKDDYSREYDLYRAKLVEYEAQLTEYTKKQTTGKESAENDAGPIGDTGGGVNGTSTENTNAPVKPAHPIDRGILEVDATIEGLLLKLQNCKRGKLVLRDELNGWFSSFGRYAKTGSDSDSSFFLEAYQGNSFSVTRKTTESFTVDRCSVSITGTIQPEVLKKFLQRSMAMYSGFLQRFFMAMPPSKKTCWDSIYCNCDAIQKIFDDLFKFTFQTPKHDSYVVKLSPGALDLFIAEHDRIEDEKSKEQSELLLAFLSKHCAKVARLALIFHCIYEAAGGCPHEVEVDCMRRAIGVAQWFYNETVRCMAILGYVSVDNDRKNRELSTLELIKQKGPVTKREISRLRSNLPDVAGILTSLLAKKLIVKRETKPERRGRPTVIYEAITDDTIDGIDTNMKFPPP